MRSTGAKIYRLTVSPKTENSNYEGGNCSKLVSSFVFSVHIMYLLRQNQVNSGHSLENCTGSRSGVDDTTISANLITSNFTNAIFSTIRVSVTEPGLL